MLREGEGEKLESIAESEQIPAPRVRKRVSRLRRHLRAQWKKEVALLAALGVVVLLIVLAHRSAHEPIAHDRARPVPSDLITPEPALSAPPVLSPPPPPLPPPAPTHVAPSPSASPMPSSTSTPSTPPRRKASHPSKSTGTGSSI
jgi:hypothetical protein